jgi:hypothetical protein
MNDFTNMELEEIQNAVVMTMRNNLDKWGSSDWYLFIGVDGYVTIDHNTTCYRECCANREPAALISMYDFDGDGWFVFDDDDNPVLPDDDSIDDWKSSEMFSISEIQRWIDNDS